MVRAFRFAALVVVLGASAVADAPAQAPPLVFTLAVPDRTSPETTVRGSAVVDERGLALWGGTASDFELGVDLAGPKMDGSFDHEHDDAAGRQPSASNLSAGRGCTTALLHRVRVRRWRRRYPAGMGRNPGARRPGACGS